MKMTLVESVKNFKKLYGEDLQGRKLVTRNGSYCCIPAKKLDGWKGQGWKEIDIPVEPKEAKKVEETPAQKKRTRKAK